MCWSILNIQKHIYSQFSQYHKPPCRMCWVIKKKNKNTIIWEDFKVKQLFDTIALSLSSETITELITLILLPPLYLLSDSSQIINFCLNLRTLIAFNIQIAYWISLTFKSNIFQACVTNSIQQLWDFLSRKKINFIHVFFFPFCLKYVLRIHTIQLSIYSDVSF